MESEQSRDLGLTSTDLTGDLNLSHALGRSAAHGTDEFCTGTRRRLIGTTRNPRQVSGHSQNIANIIVREALPGGQRRPYAVSAGWRCRREGLNRRQVERAVVATQSTRDLRGYGAAQHSRVGWGLPER